MDNDSAVAAESVTGITILVLDGKPVRTPSAPATAGVLSGKTGVSVSEAVKAAIQFTDPDGKTVQAEW